jgi:hypothetical protein
VIPIHKTESANSVLGAYVDGPPGTTISAADLNAIQNEICYVITQSGAALLTTATDTHQQLWTALTSSATLAGMGVTATAAELNSVCDNCTATAAELSTTVHTCTATAAEINTVCDGGTAKNSHTHILISGATDLTATFTEINNTVHNCTATAAEINTVCDGLQNVEQRSIFSYKDIDEIYLGGACYRHAGTTYQMVYWTATLTYQFTGLVAATWYYLYLDDSAIVTAGTNVITASELIHSDTGPTWSNYKRGWYNGNDRCIFAVRTDAFSHLLEFIQAKDFVMSNPITDLTTTDVADTPNWTSVSLTIPIFSNVANIEVGYFYAGENCSFLWRPSGTQLAGNILINCVAVPNSFIMPINVITNLSQTIQVCSNIATDDTIYIKTHGWYFPIGM